MVTYATLCSSGLLENSFPLPEGGGVFQQTARLTGPDPICDMKILLVDDHPMFREGLKFLLREGFKLSAPSSTEDLEMDEAGTCTEALERVVATNYDLVLLDLKMPGQNGLNAISAFREAVPTLLIVVLSAEEDPRTMWAAIECGASGFILKSSPHEILIPALRLVLAKGIYLPDNARDHVGSEARIADITPRETEVLRLVIKGAQNKVIARELGIADSTVKQHVSAVLEKMNVKTRTEAVSAALKLGLRLD
jgi:DNA-binding NarL/FixJ family response regulator